MHRLTAKSWGGWYSHGTANFNRGRLSRSTRLIKRPEGKSLSILGLRVNPRRYGIAFNLCLDFETRPRGSDGFSLRLASRLLRGASRGSAARTFYSYVLAETTSKNFLVSLVAACCRTLPTSIWSQKHSVHAEATWSEVHSSFHSTWKLHLLLTTETWRNLKKYLATSSDSLEIYRKEEDF